MLLFTDDSKTVAPVRDHRDQVRVQHNLTAIGNWSIRNHLPLCIEKSACLHYGFRNRQYAYNINGEAIRSVTECADLGILRTTDFAQRQKLPENFTLSLKGVQKE